MYISRKRQWDERELVSDEDQPSTSRRRPPTFLSVIRGAMMAETIKGICSSLEPMIRRVIHDEVQQVICGLNPLYGAPQYYLEQAVPVPQSHPLHCEELPTHKLVFANHVPEPIYTNNSITGTDNNHLQIHLIDINTGQICSTIEGSPIKAKIVVIDGDLKPEGLDSVKFSGKIVKPREGKRPLLVGNTEVTLNGGVGNAGDIYFTDNSKSLRCGKFRLGVFVDSERCGTTIKIQEGLTEKFAVMDHRGESYKKHYPPKPTDEVWRIEKIAKDGRFHERLKNNSINNVQGFLEKLNTEPTELKEILKMSASAWNKVVKHALTCPMGLNSVHMVNHANIATLPPKMQKGVYGNGAVLEETQTPNPIVTEPDSWSPFLQGFEPGDDFWSNKY